MDLQFKDNETTLVMTLQQTAQAVQGESITLRQLLEVVGEQSLLLFCSLLTLPFLLPVSIPGVSTVFGIIIILIGVGVTLNRFPWLPRFLMDRSIKRDSLVPALEQGVKLFSRLERWVKPRLQKMTTGSLINRMNGLGLIAGGAFLLFPLSFIPLSNTLPGYAVLALAVGMLQRDGYVIVAGYALLLLTTIYFGGLTLILVMGGQTLIA